MLPDEIIAADAVITKSKQILFFELTSGSRLTSSGEAGDLPIYGDPIKKIFSEDLIASLGYQPGYQPDVRSDFAIDLSGGKSKSLVD